MNHTRPIDRRQLLIGATATAGVAVLGGCNSEQPESETTAGIAASDVPLRVLLVGTEEDAAAIQRGWGAVAEKPLAVTTLSPAVDSIESVAAEVLTGALTCDVLVYPLILVSDLDGEDSITSLSDRESKQYEEVGDLYAALRSGAASYSGQNIGVPLGAPMPALISAEALPGTDSMLDWEAYDQCVESTWKGSACEPTAPGWAGAMFLWRASGIAGWLFDRDTLEPLIDAEPYVKSLTQMQITHAKYQAPSQTPDAIWTAVAERRLAGGIGFPLVRSVTGEPGVIQPMPGVEQTSGIPLNPFTRLASLSINCRQSGAAKQFMRWICGGEGSSSTRSQVTSMTESRIQMSSKDSSIGSSGTPEYDRFLADCLSGPITLPTLRIRQGAYYYRVLDEQVRRVLSGDVEPAVGLATVAEQWQAKTNEIGRDAQMRAWRRAQGMRG